MSKPSKSLSDVPEIMGKFITILDEEADRMREEVQRSANDMRTAIACLTALNQVNKDINTEVIEYRRTIQQLSPERLKELAEEAIPNYLPEHTSEEREVMSDDVGASVIAGKQE